MRSVYEALAHPVRRKIIQLLSKGPLSAGEIASHFDYAQPTITGHLNVLKEAGLVYSVRDKNNIIYYLNTSIIEHLVVEILDLVGRSSLGKEDTDEREQRKNSL